MKQKPTLKEIAAIAGVSISTVSRTLNTPEKVKYMTRKKIEKVFGECWSQQNGKRSGIIGFIVPNLSNHFFPAMLSSIEASASQNGMTTLIAASNGLVKNEETLIKKLLDIGVDGIIMIPCSHRSPFLEKLQRENLIPLSFLDRDPGFDSINLVAAENYMGMYQSTRYLLTLGHKKILYLGGVKGTSTNEERLRGFLKAMSDSGETVSESSIAYADYNFNKAYSLVLNLFSERRDYSAICSANDLMALGAMQALNKLGIKIPEDISVIGFDDIPSAEHFGLTTVRQPFQEMGRNAFFQLMAEINEPRSPRKKNIIPCTIIFRRSCAINRVLIGSNKQPFSVSGRQIGIMPETDQQTLR